jgi:hypothetical protein
VLDVIVDLDATDGGVVQRALPANLTEQSAVVLGTARRVRNDPRPPDESG